MLTKEWIGGFISGEGCFTFLNKNAGNIPIFQITLSAKDLNLLDKIKQHIGLGKVYIAKKNFSYTYVVSKVKECIKLIKYLDNNIYGDKLIDYENWKLGINFMLLISKKERLSKHDKEFINKLKPRQNKIRKIFIEKDVPQHIKIIRICQKCKKEFYSNNGLHQYCSKKCKPKVDKKHIIEWQRNFRKKNPEYYKNYQRKKLNIPEERWRS